MPSGTATHTTIFALSHQVSCSPQIVPPLELINHFADVAVGTAGNVYLLDEEIFRVLKLPVHQWHCHEKKEYANEYEQDHKAHADCHVDGRGDHRRPGNRTRRLQLIILIPVTAGKHRLRDVHGRRGVHDP